MKAKATANYSDPFKRGKLRRLTKKQKREIKEIINANS